MTLTADLLADPKLAADPLARALIPVLCQPTGLTSAGYPFLQRQAWEAFRDGVPHILGMGLRTLRALETIRERGEALPAGEAKEHLSRACRVARQIVMTAAITAPCDLWLVRHVLCFLRDLGLVERLLAGEAIYPESCWVEVEGERRQLQAKELNTDLQLLLARGLVEQYDLSFRVAGHPRVRALLSALVSEPTRAPADVSRLWRRLFLGETLSAAEQDSLLDLCYSATRRGDPAQNHWIPTVEEVNLGYRLLPIVLGLRASERTAELKTGTEVSPLEWSPHHPVCAGGALEVLTAAGWTEREGERYRVTRLGARGFARGPGPFGIIETYHPYLSQGREILLGERGEVWVTRSENVGASQDANRATFVKANDSLDRLCADTGFEFTVFVEHAIGRGEATRQRYERSGDKLRYFGADLEDAAIDAAMAEQAAGRLPANMGFVRGADIGRPDVLLDALRAAGAEPEGAVMLVGNGFHEVRSQTDAGMTEVFRGYHEAGVVLLFTEENALSVDDLRATAWNTYHAGFKYVHEKSGQGLRPAEPRAHVRLGQPLRAAWSECARSAGYVRAQAYCARTRTIYPYTPPSGHNPSISVNHVFVPGPLAAKLGLEA